MFQPNNPPTLEAVSVGWASRSLRGHNVRVILSKAADEECVQLGVLIVVELSLQDVAQVAKLFGRVQGC